MSDEHNWRLYNEEVDRATVSNSPYIIFLGIFLTYTVKYNSYEKLRKTRSEHLGKELMQRRKKSIYDSYTVLEAITIRRRLTRAGSECHLTMTTHNSQVLGRDREFESSDRKEEEEGEGEGADKQDEVDREGEVEKENKFQNNSELEIISNLGDGEQISFILSADSNADLGLVSDQSTVEPQATRFQTGRDFNNTPVVTKVPTLAKNTHQKSQVNVVEDVMQVGLVPAVKRGRSLEQLLQVCYSSDERFYLMCSRSLSMPGLSTHSQLSKKAEKEEDGEGGGEKGGENGRIAQQGDGGGQIRLLTQQSDPGTLTSSQPRIMPGSIDRANGVLVTDNSSNTYYTESKSPPISNGIPTQSLHNNCTSKSCIFPLTKAHRSLTNWHPIHFKSDKPLHSESQHQHIKSQSPPPDHLRHPRKRYTTADIQHVLQLHLSRVEVTKNPVSLLEQHQIQSLGYSLQLHSRPQLRALLLSCRPQHEAYLFKKSYYLEP